MAAVRRNVVTDGAARKSFIDGVLALKADHIPGGPTTADIGLPGPPQPVSTYDLFIIWHHLAMFRFTPPTQPDRNAAHSGPVFLPWHRLMLALFELQLQRVLGDDTAGLPYWDWAADGDLPPGQQVGAALWTDPTGIGGSGDPVVDGPFRETEFRVRLVSNGVGQLILRDRGLRRELGQAGRPLPATAAVADVLRDGTYDADPWDRGSPGFRNRIEGWGPVCCGMHNHVHNWVGGDMGPASSPNDPVFYLNHCNVDRVWEAWMTGHGRVYEPGPMEDSELAGHRLDDRLYSILIRFPVTPANVLDISELYSYDVLPSA
jgi:tyrosinase